MVKRVLVEILTIGKKAADGLKGAVIELETIALIFDDSNF